jgi:hypothetical protein
MSSDHRQATHGSTAGGLDAYKYRFKLLYAITVFRVPVKVPRTKSLKLGPAAARINMCMYMFESSSQHPVADAISPPQSEKEGAHRKKQKLLLYHCERGRSGVPCLRQTRYEQSFAARMQGCRRISNIRRRGGCPLRRIRSSKRRKPRHCAR